MYTSSESWINNLSIDVLLGSDNIYLRYNYLNIWNLRVQNININIEKIAFKVVQMKFLTMHINNQNWSLRNVLNIFMEHDLYLIS